MKQHYFPNELLERLAPTEIGLKYTSVRRLEINGQTNVFSGSEEVCLVCIDGQGEFETETVSGHAKEKDMLYLPINTKAVLKGTNCVWMQFGAPCLVKTKAVFIPFEEVDQDERHKIYGNKENGTRRDVWNYIDENFDSGRFLVGVCSGTNGGWTAWPPHEHGAAREETYVYFGMGDSFGIQCVYEDLESPVCVAIVKDGHLVSIPKGYHPNCGCPCGGISYVYCMVATEEGKRDFMDLHCQEIYGNKLE